MKKIYLVIVLFFFACTAKIFAQVNPPEKPGGSGKLVKVNASSVDPKISSMLNFYDKKIYFTENKGQWPDSVLYKADFPLGQALVTTKGMIVGIYDAEAMAAHNAQSEREEKAQHDGVKFNESKVKVPAHGWLMNFVNHSDAMHIEGLSKHSDYYNYFLGTDASKYATNVGSYQEIWYKNVYNNVDVRYYPSETGTLEYDIVCKPGFDKNDIAIQLQGIDNMYLKDNGHLVLKTSVGDAEFPAPVVYQKINGIEEHVDAKYILRNNILSFEIGSYDEAQPLIIDPIALRWATWMTNNSTQANHCHAIWVDQTTGYIYVLARVASSGLITVNAIQDIFEGASFDDENNEIGEYIEPDTIGNPGERVWQTYIGGTAGSNPYALEQAANGDLIFAGELTEGTYPLSGGSYYNNTGTPVDDPPTFSGDKIFITKINTAGNSFKSAIIGGNGSDNPFDVRTTSNSDILVCGNTTSTNLATVFPGTGATNAGTGTQHVLVFRITNDLDSIIWMRNYGGSGFGGDGATIMNTNQTTGEIFVAGTTTSTDFPTTKPRQATYTGTEDGFIQKLDPLGNIVWSSYFQAAAGQYDEILAMELNTTQTSVYLAGLTTGLAASNVSTSKVFQSNISGTTDFFVAKMDTNQNFDEGTYLGAGGEAEIMGLNTDLNNDVYVLGYTTSTDYPVTAAIALQSSNLTTINGGHNEVFTKLSTSLDTLEYSTYYGGTADDYDPIGERGIKFFNCRVFTVFTSESDNVPLTAGAITTTKLSSTNIYEPGFAVWANPPDLTNNTISGNQQICEGTTPKSAFTGSAPSYVLPKISRNSVISSYPVNLNSLTTYQWQYSTDSINWTNVPNGTTQNLADSLIGPLMHTTYYRRIIGGDACIIAGDSDQSIKITVIPSPVVTAVSSLKTICKGSSTTITASGANIYQWSPLAGLNQTNGSLVTATPSITTTYKVTGTDTAGCTDTTSIPIRVIQDSLKVSPDTSAICQGNSVVIIAAGASNYIWSPSGGLNIASGDSVIATPSLSTTYTLNASGTDGCPDSEKVFVKVNLPPILTIEPSAPQICLGHPTKLSVTGASIYTWSPSAGLSRTTGDTLTANPTVTTTYTAYGTDVQGCNDSTKVVVTVNPLPVVTVTPPSTIICNGSSVTLTANGASTYQWNPSIGLSSTSNSSVSANPTISSIYTVYGVNTTGCADTTTVAVRVIQDSLKVSTDNPAICQGNSVIIIATGASDYVWSPSTGLNKTTGDTITANPTITSSYTLIASGDNGCPDTEKVVVNVNLPPILTIAPATPQICIYRSTPLTVSGASTYTWSPSAGLSQTSGSSITASPTVTTTYTAYGTDVEGCNDSAKVVIIVNPLPHVTAVTSMDTICHGLSVTLTANGATSYQWSPTTGLSSSTNAVVQAGPTITTTYSVYGTDALGCIDTAMVTVNIIPNSIKILLFPVNSIVCLGDSASLTATGGLNYAWTPSTALSATSGSMVISKPTTATTYTVIGVGTGDCADTTVAVISVSPPPVISVAPLAPIICDGQSILLTASGGTRYIWYPSSGLSNSTGSSITANPNTTSTYTLYGSDSLECVDSAKFTLTVDSNPIGAFTFNIPSICYPLQIQLSNSSLGGTSYLWSFGDGSTSTEMNPSHEYSNPGDYKITLIVTSASGCTDTVTATDTSSNYTAGLFIPSSFTPGVPGVNQIFRPNVECSAPGNYLFRVYNRWGEMMYSTSNPSDGWDGTYNGKTEPLDVYVYYVEMTCGTCNFFKKGNVTLLK